MSAGTPGVAFRPATEIARLIRDREVSCAEVLATFLERIATLNPRLHAFLTVDEGSARAAAASADAALRSDGFQAPPLHGVPIAIKDLMSTKGLRTTFGSQLFSDNVPDVDDVAVQRLRDAGAVIVGKTNTSEFGMSLETYNRLGPDARNPWDPDRTTGGSSGGSAAAVCAGMVPAATGTDAAGSVNNPAGMCGIYGLKPTRGRIPLWPPFDSPLFNTVGMLTRTVSDGALMLSVMAGHDPRDADAIREPPRRFVADAEAGTGLRIGFSPDLGRFEVDREILHAVGDGAQVIRQLGNQVDELEFEVADPFDGLFLPLWRADVRVGLGELYADQLDRLHSDSREELTLARDVSAGDYVLALARLRRFRSDFMALFDEHDLLVTPNSPVPAFPVGQPPAAGWAPFLGFTAVCNLTGAPAAAVPCGFTSDELPASMLLIAPPGAEAAVLALSAAFERARPWATQLPPVQ